MTLESFLNAVIPWIIGIVGIYLLYKPLKEPLSGFFKWIGGLIKSNKDNESISDYTSDFKLKSIDYE